jgi:hypothetical protein
MKSHHAKLVGVDAIRQTLGGDLSGAASSPWVNFTAAPSLTTTLPADPT